MQEVQPKENLLGLKVFINGIPDMTVIPKERRRASSLPWNWRFQSIMKHYQPKQCARNG